MAAYAATVALDMPKPERISRTHGLITGTVTLSNYNATLSEITGITRFFIDDTLPVKVTSGGPSANGYLVSWVEASKAFKAWKPNVSASVSGPLVEVGSDVNVGAIEFTAVGLIA